jgi:hypothetical protein
MKCFELPNLGGLLPSDADGPTAPPAGAPNYFVRFDRERLEIYGFHVDWSHAEKMAFGPPVKVKVAPFVPATESGVRQPAGAALDALGDRLMYRLAYRHFSSHESLVVNHTVARGDATAIRWYELRDPGGTPEVYQQGTYAPDAGSRWMGSTAMDAKGNLLLAYSVSGPQIKPSIRIAGRRAEDPLGSLSAEREVVSGRGAQFGVERWGDYSSVSVDPADDCSFWLTAQHLPKDGSYNWDTSVARVRMAGCN